MNQFDVLEKLGLEKNEIHLYKALLSQPPLTIGEISKTTGLYRPVIYKILPGLISKNLISKSQKGKRWVYLAESPNHLNHLFEKSKLELEQLLPVLQKTFENKQKPLIRYFEGKDGIRHVYNDLLEKCKKGDVIYRYESPKDFMLNKKYYPALYLNRAAGKTSEIQKFVITNEETQKLRSPRLDRYSKAIPAKFDPFDYDITQIIYKDRVAFIDYKTEIASIIEGGSFAKFQRQIFKLLFEKI